ncbi:PIN domain-containing protein [Desulfobacterales bacterium HSG16]|nr:PIN domain-containing protein [Desulfobacterales bacterium HSG16]
MILLDTNVVSEVMRQNPSNNVVNWLNKCNNINLFISSITIAEICYGLRILPEGQRRQLLQSRFEQFVSQGFAQNIIDFDESAARAYAK